MPGFRMLRTASHRSLRVALVVAVGALGLAGCSSFTSAHLAAEDTALEPEDAPLPPLDSLPPPPKPASCATWLQLQDKLRPFYERLTQVAPPYGDEGKGQPKEPAWTWNEEVVHALQALYTELEAQIPVLKGLPDSDLPANLESGSITYSSITSRYQSILKDQKLQDDPVHPQPGPSGVNLIETMIAPTGTARFITEFCQS